MKRIIFLFAVLLLCSTAFAQFNIKDKIKDKATGRAEQRVDEALDKGIDKIEEGVTNIFKKKKKDKNAGEEEVSQSEETEESSGNDKNASGSRKSDLASYNKYDFVPGNEVIFEDDLKGEQKGEFPSKWDLVEGNAENATVNGENTIAIVGFTYITPLFKNKSNNYLTDAFTLEYDFLIDDKEGENTIELLNASGDVIFSTLFWKDNTRFLSKWGMEDTEKTVEDTYDNSKGWHHLALSFNKRAMKIYVDEKRVANIPNMTAKPAKVKFFARGPEDNSTFHIKNVRIANGAVPLYDKLLTDGKIITYGITFDVGKSTIKPQSMGTINEIFNILKKYPELKFSVEGHTDNTGKSDMNQTLSEDRAKAVMDKLVSLGIDENRLSSKGFGMSKPIDNNSTTEGRAKNRRVEFVKM